MISRTRDDPRERYGHTTRISRYMKHEKASFDGLRYDTYEARCFRTIAESVQKYAFSIIPDSSSCRIA